MNPKDREILELRNEIRQLDRNATILKIALAMLAVLEGYLIYYSSTLSMSTYH